MTGPLLDLFCALIRLYDYISTPSLHHCLRYGANYGPGREPCTAKVFSPGLGVVPGSVFNTVHRTTLPLASPGSPHWFFKVVIVSLQIGLRTYYHRVDGAGRDGDEYKYKRASARTFRHILMNCTLLLTLTGLLQRLPAMIPCLSFLEISVTFAVTV